MFKPFYGHCNFCDKDHQLIVVKAGYCQKCNHEKKEAKKKAEGKKKDYSHTYKPTGEMEIFMQVWQESNGRCFVCDKPIIYPIASNFAHLASKALNRYPKYKLYKPNIKILCHDSETSCHRKLDTWPLNELKKDKRFDEILRLKEELIKQYPNII